MKKSIKIISGFIALLIAANIYTGYLLFKKNISGPILGNELYKEAIQVQERYRNLKKQGKTLDDFTNPVSEQGLERKVDTKHIQELKNRLCEAYSKEYGCNFEEVDLNDDGIYELQIIPKGMCGSGGCDTYFFDSNKNKLLYLFGWYNISNDKTKGYKNINQFNRTYNDKACNKGEFEYLEKIYIWNGFAYELEKATNYCK